MNKLGILFTSRRATEDEKRELKFENFVWPHWPVGDTISTAKVSLSADYIFHVNCTAIVVAELSLFLLFRDTVH